MRKSAWFIAALLVAACEGQTVPSNAGRKKIGVALSGGSAFGLAHVGALQWLEEHRIPVDYIAGTSMGGLVGGLHATGHNSAEMRKFVSEIDWQQTLSAVPPFRDLSFRRKEDQREVPTNLEFGYKNGLRLPSGLSGGHGVGLVLSRFTAAYGDLASFNDLPTPFRCIATDLVGAKAVVFDRGPLFDALRATMSLPALFAPVEDGKRILVDGGLVNNVPVDIVKAMGADIVIAVALNRPPDPKAYQSLLGVAGRSISVMISENERRNLDAAELVVNPDLDGFTSADYPQHDALRQRGYEAAQKQEAFLRKLAVSESEYAAYVAARTSKRRPEAIAPKFVEVIGDLPPRRKAALIAAIEADNDGTVDRSDLEAEMTKLTGLGRFDTAAYQFVKRNGEDGLRVQVHEKRHGPPFLRVGILLDGNPDEGIRFGIGGRLTFLDAGGPGSEWRSDLSIGQVDKLATEYYYRIRGGKWFIAPRGYFLADQLPFYQGDQRVLEYSQREVGGGADFGYAFGRFAEVRAGYDIGGLRYAVDTGLFPGAVKGRTSGFNVRYRYDKQDSPIVPRHGFRTELRGWWMTDYPAIEKQFGVLRGELSYARPIRGRYSWLWEAEGGTTRDEATLSARFYTGGLFHLSALARGQYIGSSYYGSRLTVLRAISDPQLALFGRLYLAAGWEMGNAWYQRPTPRPFHDGVVGVLGETPLGVLFFGGSWGEGGNGKILFRLGRYF